MLQLWFHPKFFLDAVVTCRVTMFNDCSMKHIRRQITSDFRASLLTFKGRTAWKASQAMCVQCVGYWILLALQPAQKWYQVVSRKLSSKLRASIRITTDVRSFFSKSKASPTDESPCWRNPNSCDFKPVFRQSMRFTCFTVRKSPSQYS